MFVWGQRRTSQGTWNFCGVSATWLNRNHRFCGPSQGINLSSFPGWLELRIRNPCEHSVVGGLSPIRGKLQLLEIICHWPLRSNGNSLNTSCPGNVFQHNTESIPEFPRPEIWLQVARKGLYNCPPVATMWGRTQPPEQPHTEWISESQTVGSSSSPLASNTKETLAAMWGRREDKKQMSTFTGRQAWDTDNKVTSKYPTGPGRLPAIPAWGEMMVWH